MSAPAPFTVTTPFDADALPAAPTLPTSCDIHGADSVAGGGATPTPVSGTACGLRGALLYTHKVADSDPFIEGLNWMSTVQLAFGASVALTHVVEPIRNDDTCWPLRPSV